MLITACSVKEKNIEVLSSTEMMPSTEDNRSVSTNASNDSLHYENIDAVPVPEFDVNSEPMPSVNQILQNDISMIIYQKNGVDYPVFLSIINADKINQLITDEVSYILSEYKIVNEESFVHCRITLANENYISLVFEGLVYSTELPYPRKVFSCITIDTNAGERLMLTDIIRINDDFINGFMQALQLKFQKMGVDVSDVFTQEEIKERLLSADVRTENINPKALSYFNNDTVYIRLSLPHVLGDFIEIEMPMVSWENDQESIDD
ncbi:MAG: hypothetical protein Ta2A_10680 [Treponemataceae bacterium]|nr:MAG: hypothetical protein Ta2A_10680 [Treponemataceae bacterium]